MGFFAEPWLREARESIKLVPDRLATLNEWSPADMDKLAAAVEKAIKAALIENHGSIPQKFNHDKLVSLCQSTGVWEVLPPALKHLIQEVESYRAVTITNTHEQAMRPASIEQLQKYFAVARRLIDYMEYHVIGNDSVLRRLKVA